MKNKSFKLKQKQINELKKVGADVDQIIELFANSVPKIASKEARKTEEYLKSFEHQTPNN